MILNSFGSLFKNMVVEFKADVTANQWSFSVTLNFRSSSSKVILHSPSFKSFLDSLPIIFVLCYFMLQYILFSKGKKNFSCPQRRLWVIESTFILWFLSTSVKMPVNLPLHQFLQFRIINDVLSIVCKKNVITNTKCRCTFKPCKPNDVRRTSLLVFHSVEQSKMFPNGWPSWQKVCDKMTYLINQNVWHIL